MLVLAIETSCDETAAAMVENGSIVYSNVISSSQEQFADMGGVIPEEAARQQLQCIMPVIQKALVASKAEIKDIDAIAVTEKPGLLVSLLVGLTTTRTLAALWKKPLIGVDHTHGHLSSIWLERTEEPKFPCLALSISGGHCQLWRRESHTQAELLSETRDDAVGEAFDKGATMLGLPYPGGPAINKAAVGGNADAYPFPQPLRNEQTTDWSFSGLKTALKYTVRDHPNYQLADLAASYETALCTHLVMRVLQAAEANPHIQELHVVGGVSANARLRGLLAEALPNFTILYPIKMEYCTDNAAMIASSAYFTSLKSTKGR